MAGSYSVAVIGLTRVIATSCAPPPPNLLPRGEEEKLLFIAA
jgi:hypothetical protein